MKSYYFSLLLAGSLTGGAYNGSAFASLEETLPEVAHYLNTYFNLDRRYSALGYRSPHQFEYDFQTILAHCPFLLNHTSFYLLLGQLNELKQSDDLVDSEATLS